MESFQNRYGRCQGTAAEETWLAKKAVIKFPDNGFLLEPADSLAGRRV